MRKKLGYILIVLGAALILSALLLLLYNQQENEQADEISHEMLVQIQTHIEEQKAVETPPPVEELPEETEISESKVSMVNGYNYLGVLELPSLSLELPVLSDCEEALLKIAPCRDYGDLSTKDLVIAAHNYRSHFGRLSQLQYGDVVTFTDMAGGSHSYKVAEIMTISQNDVLLVTDSGYELVLYTCDYTNQNRIAVYCREAENESD